LVVAIDLMDRKEGNEIGYGRRVISEYHVRV
jgi:hypothetical protein